MDSDYKVELLTGFVGSNKNGIARLELSENMLPNLDVLSQIYINKNLKELTLMSQTFFITNSVLDEPKFRDIKINKTLERLHLGLGIMRTIKPLVYCLSSFPKLKSLAITNVDLGKLYF